MVTEEPPPNRVLAGAADFGRCSPRRERQFQAVASPSGTRVHLRHVPAVATPHNDQGDRRCHDVFDAQGGVGLVFSIAVNVVEVRQRNLPLSGLMF